MRVILVVMVVGLAGCKESAGPPPDQGPQTPKGGELSPAAKPLEVAAQPEADPAAVAASVCAKSWTAILRADAGAAFDQRVYSGYCIRRLTEVAKTCAATGRGREAEEPCVSEAAALAAADPTDGLGVALPRNPPAWKPAAPRGSDYEERAREICADGWRRIVRKGGGAKFDESVFTPACVRRLTRTITRCSDGSTAGLIAECVRNSADEDSEDSLAEALR